MESVSFHPHLGAGKSSTGGPEVAEIRDLGFWDPKVSTQHRILSRPTADEASPRKDDVSRCLAKHDVAVSPWLVQAGGPDTQATSSHRLTISFGMSWTT